MCTLKMHYFGNSDAVYSYFDTEKDGLAAFSSFLMMMMIMIVIMTMVVLFVCYSQVAHSF